MKLFKNYTKEFEQLKLEVISTRNHLVNHGNANTEKTLLYIQDVEKSISKLENQYISLSKEIAEIKQLLVENFTEPTKEEVIIKEESSPNIVFGKLKLSKSSKKDFRYDTVDKTTYKFSYVVRNRTYFSDYTINDVQLIKLLEEEYDSYSTWVDLQHMLGMQAELIKKIAYNIKKGFFDQFIQKNDIAFSKEYGLLYIDGKKINVPVRTAKYIVECVNNSSHPATTILKLEKTGECPKEICRLIGVNSKNGKLTSLFEDNPIELENNPQKRKEKGL